MADKNTQSEIVLTEETSPEADHGVQAAPSRRRPLAIWLGLNLVVGGYFASGIMLPASSVSTAWLPGQTTHGHYQIELQCSACHGAVENTSDHSSANVMTDACNRCHADQLKLVKDTHPAKKFNDPTNAALLATLDAQDCLACHREHVPERTLEMGLTMPADYCWHCHQDVADSRPSHESMAFDSCATAGCHNYHNNRALYEKFLDDHHGEPDFKSPATIAIRTLAEQYLASVTESPDPNAGPKPNIGRADAPQAKLDDGIVADWSDTAHAIAGVNCSGCHNASDNDGWSDSVALETCQSCHPGQSETFLRGRHGMRLAEGLSPMTPAMARLPMHAGASHQELTCNSCHAGHRFDTQFAAVDACKQCHADSHTIAYDDSVHAALWADELAGIGEPGSGVSCATCHLPRLTDDDGEVWVNHNQNDNLRPNETMARDVCLQCHGLEYSLSALADPKQKSSCYSDTVVERTKSVEMAHQWFVDREAKRNKRQARK